MSTDQELDLKALRELYESEKDKIDGWAKDEKSSSHLLAKLMKELVAEGEEVEKKGIRNKISRLLRRFRKKIIS